MSEDSRGGAVCACRASLEGDPLKGLPVHGVRWRETEHVKLSTARLRTCGGAQTYGLANQRPDVQSLLACMQVI